MNAILLSLLHLAQRTGLFTEAEATAAYNGLWRRLAYALTACAVAFLLNVSFGMKAPSLLLALMFAIVAFYVWAKPLHVLGIASTGLVAKIVTHADLVTEVEKILGFYLELLKWVLIVGGVFLLTTGTFSFKGSPLASLTLLLSLGVVGLFILKWPNVFVGTLGRRFFYTAALLIAVFSFVSIILGPMWIMKYIGLDPLNARSTSTEEAIYLLDHTRREMADADRTEELKRITDKINRHEALTQADDLIIADARLSQSNKKQLSQQDCSFSSTDVRQCVITEEGILLSVGESIRPGEFEFCFIKPEKASFQSEWVGQTAVRVKSTTGTFVLAHKMIKRENLINGKCPEKF